MLLTPLVIGHPVELCGEVTSIDTPGTTGLCVGVDADELEPVAWPSVELVNRGHGDGLLIQADDVIVRHLAIRGTTGPGVTAGVADISAWNVNGLTLDGVVVGLDRAGGLTAPPVTDRTGNVPLFQALNSTNVHIERSAFGWNGQAWGAVGLWATTNSHVYRTMVAAAGGKTVGPSTFDALSIVFGSNRIIVRECHVDRTFSSSAVELHSASTVTIDRSTFTASGRAGVTAFDAHDVTIDGVVIEAAGTAGRPPADMGGVVIYPNSERVKVVGDTRISTVAGLPTVAVL